MKPIKYRAYKKDNGKNKWMTVKSLWIKDDGTISHIFGEVLVGDSQTWFDGFELVQFTGLKDKNGKEIYEGYIVRREGSVFSPELTLKVFWNDKVACFQVGDWAIGHINEPLKVIGNIYENPELLK